jgi:molybdopterin converting factor subunit 1
MKNVKIRYFALLREQAKTETEHLITECETYADIYSELRAKYNFTLPAEMVQVAVNDEFSHMKEKVVDGVVLVFIPPVAGG